MIIFRRVKQIMKKSPFFLNIFNYILLTQKTIKIEFNGSSSQPGSRHKVFNCLSQIKERQRILSSKNVKFTEVEQILSIQFKGARL